MADRKISELTNITGANLADDDEFALVDTSADETKAITFGEFKTALDTATGFVRITGDTMTGDLSMGDNVKAIFGAGPELQIYSDGTSGIIKDVGAGDIKILADDFYVQNAAGNSTLISVLDTGKVGLGFAGFEKLATTSTGVDITGVLSSDGLTTTGATVNTSPLRLQSNDTSVNLGESIGDIEFYSNDSSGGGVGVQAKIRAIADNSFGTSYALNLLTGTSASPLQRLNIGSGGDISFYEATGTTPKFFWDAAAESLGIGTSNPASILDVLQSDDITDVADINSGAKFGRVNSSGDGQTSGLFLLASGNGGSNNGWAGMSVVQPDANSHNADLTFITRGSSIAERMRITSAGNVGIGTTSPQRALSIGTHGSSSSAEIAFGTTTTGNASLLFGDGTTGTALYDGYIQYQHNGGNMLFATGGGSERMRIDSSGNVGIGTSSPDLVGSTTSLTINNSGGNGQLSLMGNGTVYGRIFADNATGDLKMGNPTSNDVMFYTANLERMRIDSSGNVGIGTSSPDTALHVAGKSTVRNTIVSNFTLDGGVQVPNPYDGFGFGIDFIGRDYGNAVRDYAYIYSVMEASGSSAGGGDASFKAGLRFYTNGGGASGTIPTERMRINSSGNLLVNTIASQSGLAKAAIEFDSGSQYGLEIKDAGSGTTGTLGIFYRGTTAVGSISTNGSTTAYNTSSDYRLKENVVELTGATTRLKQLDPKRFNFIADDTTTVDGFLAHEVQSVVPEAITGIHNEVDADGNPVYQGIDQSKLVPLLVATIKELEARITALENA